MKHFLLILGWGLACVLSVFLLFEGTWLKYPDSIFDIFPFVCGLISSMLMGFHAAKIFFPGTSEITAASFFDTKKYRELQKRIGRKFNLFAGVVGLFWLFFVVTAAVIYSSSVSNYESRMLHQSGKLQMVAITDVSHIKSRRYVEFTFSWNGETYNDRLPSDSYETGDSAMIYFAADYPKIVTWPGDQNTN
ncbi:MAG: hypothetical protein ACJ77K_04135 [Bacteroidia bacterium]|jgi:hypothetical protein